MALGGGGNGSSPKAWMACCATGHVRGGLRWSGRTRCARWWSVREVGERTGPPDATHRSTRSLAGGVGLGKTTIQKIWREHGLKPHLIKGFKVSREPAFVDKVRDVVGLYINPPDHALSVDEKSQIRALERTQQPLPLIAGHAATRTHDYTGCRGCSVSWGRKRTIRPGPVSGIPSTWEAVCHRNRHRTPELSAVH